MASAQAVARQAGRGVDVKSIHARAIALYSAKDFQGALEQFEQLPPVAIVLYDMAVCYRDMGGIENFCKARDLLMTLVKGIGKIKDGSLRNQVKQAFVGMMTMIVRELATNYKLEQALVENSGAIELLRNDPILMYNQGHILKCLGRHEAAVIALERSIIYNPTYFDAYIELINIFNDAREYPKAIDAINRGIAAIPGDARFYNELGVALCRIGKVKEGFEAYQMGLELPSCNPIVAGKIYTNVGNAYSFLGDVPASLENSKKAYQADPTNTTAMQNYLMNLLYLPKNPFMDTLKQHLEIGSMFAKQMRIELAVASGVSSNGGATALGGVAVVKPYQVTSDAPLNAKIHIGFLSGDFFGEHPMTYFLKTLLTHWDRNRFEIYCYSNQKLAKVPAYSPDIKWRDVKYLDCKTVCHKVVKEDRIDVLIDLAGHTAANRLDVLSNRCARVQLSYLGYPCITGVPEVDYYVIDKTFDMRIKSIAMPNCFTHYCPSTIPAADTLVSPFHANGYFSFGTLNKLAKVNQAMVDTWDSLLDYYPTSKLLIRRNYVFKFRNQDRVVFLEHEQAYQGHMGRYNKIDIALDTAPYSGTTTTCEAMLMGTPVITLADRKNKTIHQNVSASLLIHSGMGDLVVEDLEGYKRAIDALMKRIEADPQCKQHVQRQFLDGGVCNAKQYMADFEGLVSDLHAKATASFNQ